MIWRHEVLIALQSSLKLMTDASFEAKTCPEIKQRDYSEIRQEDWVKDLLDKLSPDEQSVVLEAFKDLKRFALKNRL